MRESLQPVVSRAELLLEALHDLSFQAIMGHDKQEVKKLEMLIARLNDSPVSHGGLEVEQRTEAAVKSAESGSLSAADLQENQMARQKEILEQLKKEGMADRLGRVYDSSAAGRSTEFRRVLHRRELPEFDMVVAADFSPSPGLHGVFISASKVMSVVLEQPEADKNWKLLKQRSYDSMEEMGEYVTLLSAGFDLPE